MTTATTTDLYPTRGATEVTVPRQDPVVWGDSTSPFPRSNVFIVFNSVENTAVEPFAAPVRRPDFIGARDFKPLSFEASSPPLR